MSDMTKDALAEGFEVVGVQQRGAAAAVAENEDVSGSIRGLFARGLRHVRLAHHSGAGQTGESSDLASRPELREGDGTWRADGALPPSRTTCLWRLLDGKVGGQP